MICAIACLLVWTAGAGCKKGSKPELTPRERCQRGCEHRLRCVEELALDKAVTEANREHVKRAQGKRHQKHLDHCVKACLAERPRFQAFARCGLSAKDCEGYFRCESAAVKGLETKDPPGRPAPRTDP